MLDRGHLHVGSRPRELSSVPDRLSSERPPKSPGGGVRALCSAVQCSAMGEEESVTVRKMEEGSDGQGLGLGSAGMQRLALAGWLRVGG